MNHTPGLTRGGAVIRRAVRMVLVSLAALVVLGCTERMPPEVVVFATEDREAALPLFAEFTQAAGIKVRAKYADELGGVEQLVRVLEAEREQPKCDMLWDDELLATLQLERAGLLRSYTSAAANALPSQLNGVAMRSPGSTWYTVSTNARVLIVNTNQVPEARRPKSIEDLVDPQWYERVGIAKPLSGPSATQAACLFANWGESKAQEFYRGVKRNARIFATDREVARAVAAGTLAFGLTNASDAVAELAAGVPVAIVYPDQGEGMIGTLSVPSTVALVDDSPHLESAARLLDFVLSPEVRQQFAAAKGGTAPAHVHWMRVDFSAVARGWGATFAFMQTEFSAGE